jgi:hypothetical protein
VSPLLGILILLGAILVAAIVSRPPAVVGVTAGLLGGPLFYVWLGGHLARARGEGRFFSFPFGGYRLDDCAVALSVATWAVAAGLIAWGVARIATRRGRR